MNFEDVIIKPVLSEKATALREQNKYIFIVAPEATKIQIKEAVRKLFNVKVADCTTINVQGKIKRLRGRPGRTVVSRRRGRARRSPVQVPAGPFRKERRGRSEAWHAEVRRRRGYRRGHGNRHTHRESGGIPRRRRGFPPRRRRRGDD